MVDFRHSRRKHGKDISPRFDRHSERSMSAPSVDESHEAISLHIRTSFSLLGFGSDDNSIRTHGRRSGSVGLASLKATRRGMEHGRRGSRSVAATRPSNAYAGGEENVHRFRIRWIPLSNCPIRAPRSMTTLMRFACASRFLTIRCGPSASDSLQETTKPSEFPVFAPAQRAIRRRRSPLSGGRLSCWARSSS